MTPLRTLLITVAALLLSPAALADPVTFRGKLGNLDIVVELTADPAERPGAVAGRYFYLSKGIDIPLQARGRSGRAVELAEEEPCGAEKCGNGEAPPVGAVWTLTPGPDGRLSGTWKGGRSFDITLVRVGARAGDGADTPLALFRHSEEFNWNDEPITMRTSPYDVLRLDVPLERSRAEGWDDAKFNYAVDPRTKFAMPRVVELAGGTPDAANAELTARHWRHSLSALGCAALQYAGFTEGGLRWSTEAGTLGGHDDMFIEVRALTPRLMSWQESGSLYCGGAHPFNFTIRTVMEVATGRVLSLGDMFADVEDGVPGAALAAFVRETREKPSEGVDADFEEECGTDELIAQYLAASLRREGGELRLVFGLEGLPHVMGACADDVLELPARAARHLMRPEFAALLPD